MSHWLTKPYLNKKAQNFTEPELRLRLSNGHMNTHSHTQSNNRQASIEKY